MSITQIKAIAATKVVFVGLVLAGQPAYAQDPGPRDWLQKMTSAVQTTNYEGTVIRIQDGRVDALKVMHVVSEGVVCEKVIIQEGKDLEIIRNGNEVRFIMPDRKSVEMAFCMARSVWRSVPLNVSSRRKIPPNRWA